jgi:hypothetical protein
MRERRRVLRNLRDGAPSQPKSSTVIGDVASANASASDDAMGSTSVTKCDRAQ